MAVSTRRWAPFLSVLAAACVDGSNPVGPDVQRSVQIAAVPTFAVAPSLAEAALLTRARVTALDAGTGLTLASVQQDIDPSAGEWTLTLLVEIPTDQPVSLRLQTELASVVGDVESVEWSGRTDTFAVQLNTEPVLVRGVVLFRGPLANLDVTDIAVRNPPSLLLAGESVQLEVDLAGGSGGARAYFSSSDPAVALVDAAGRVDAVGPGPASILVQAGAVSTTVAFSVETVEIENPVALSGEVASQVDFATSATEGMGDPQAAAAILDALGTLTAALGDGNAAAAVHAFADARTAWEDYGSGTELRALDAPQIGVLELTLIVIADALGISFG